MKSIYLLIFFCFFQLSQAQSVNDTKDFIAEQIKANAPMSNYKNGVFFENNVIKYDAERISNRTLNDTDFKNIFIENDFFG